MTWKLPISGHPITLNQRMHWANKAHETKRIRTEVWARARAAGIPNLDGRCEVQLVYRPPDKRRRDSDNLAPTFKAAVDGLVDAGVLSDDTDDLVTRLHPKLGPVVASPAAHVGRTLFRLHLTVREA